MPPDSRTDGLLVDDFLGLRLGKIIATVERPGIRAGTSDQYPCRKCRKLRVKINKDNERGGKHYIFRDENGFRWGHGDICPRCYTKKASDFYASKN